MIFQVEGLILIEAESAEEALQKAKSSVGMIEVYSVYCDSE